MKRTSLHGLGLGLEDETEIEAPAEEIVPSETVDETPADEVIVVTEATDKVEESAEVVEELQEQEAALESLKIALESCVADGGLDAKSAVFFNQAYRQITDRIGLKPGTVSVESFGGGTTRLNATNISLESIKETLTKIWIAIKNAVMRAAKAIADFFAKIFGGVKTIREKATKLKDAASKATAGSESGKSITIRSAGKLQTTGKANAADFDAGIVALHEALVIGYGPYLTGLDKAFEHLSAGFKADASKDEDAKAKFMDAVKGEKPAFAGFTKVISGGYTISADKVAAEGTDAGNEGAAALIALLAVVEKTKQEQFEESQKMDALSGPEVVKMMGHVIEICDLMDKKKGAIDQSKKAREAAAKALDDAIKAAKDDPTKPGSGMVMYIKLVMRAYRKNYVAPIAKLTSIAFTASRSALVVAEKSLAAAAGKADKDEDKKDDKKE